MSVQRRRRRPVVACPDHRRSTVQAWGTLTVRSRDPDQPDQKFQRYRCVSASKSRGTHYFRLPIGREGDEVVVSRPGWSPPPRCARHPKSRVRRDGPYAKVRAGRKRQRYRCFPDCRAHALGPCPPGCDNPATCGAHPDGCEPAGHAPKTRHCAEHPAVCPKDCPDRTHGFTPMLARRWIQGHGFSDACEQCEQPHGVHTGEPNAARHHSFTSLVVAEGLIRMAGGDTYAETSQWALRLRKGRRAVRAGGSAAHRPASRARSADAWHIAADWVECWAPVIWEPLAAELGARARAQRERIDAEVAAGGTLRDPLIWVADEMVIGKKGSKQAFVVLVLAECEWHAPGEEPEVRLRLARAMPDKSQTAWLLAWDELAGPERIRPDFIVADRSLPIMMAADAIFGVAWRWVPSLWHLSRSIRAAYWGRGGGDAGIPDAPADIEAHLGGLARGSPAMASTAGWWEWWATLVGLFAGHGRDPHVLDARRENWAEPFAAAIPDLAGTWAPLSNAAVEAIQRTRLRRVFEGRDHAMTSIERTNSLLDLVVAREQHRLDSVAEVARLLREDAHAHGGWTHPARSISDPAENPRNRYRSLRDRSLTQRLVFERRLA